MKRLNIRDGVTMGHPYEIAELVQEYTNDNLNELTNALIETRGVFAPGSDELKAEVSTTDVSGGVRITIRPGFAICGAGLLHVQSETSITLYASRLRDDNEVHVRKDGSWVKKFDSGNGTVHFNLHYRETSGTPVDIVPYGSGEADLRVLPSYELKVEDSPVDISSGVTLARATGKELADQTVQDARGENVATLRADRSLLYDLVDPVHVDDIEMLFSREGFVEDMLALLDNHKLGGEDVVTEPKDAVDPFLVRYSSETSVRKRLRDLDSVESDISLTPDPEHEVTIEWNLYGVDASFDGDNDDQFVLSTDFDLQSIDYQGYDLPLYFRFNGEEHEIDSFMSSNKLKTASPVQSDSNSDTNAAITNGADEFHVDAQPGIHWFRKNKRSKDFAIESEVRAPRANLKLDPGFWNIIIQSRGQNSQSSKTIPVQISEQSPPHSPQQVSVTGEQINPSKDEGGENTPANPFEEIDLGSEGSTPISEDKLTEYVSSVRKELNRIQEQQVDLTVSITPDSRSRDSADRAIAVGYNIEVEMLTAEGWKTEREVEVHRSTKDLMREITWLDIIGNRYRGNVDTQGDLTNLSSLEHMQDRFNNEVDTRPIVEDEVVSVNNTDTGEDPEYWRYEPKMTTDQAQSTSLETHPYGVEGDGFWVRADVSKESFDPAPVEHTITDVSGGSDYRVTVEPIGEDGQMGPSVQDNTTELREAYNAELGFDFHSSITSIYSAFQDLSEQNSPEKFNKYLNNRMEEVRAAIDRAALYGTPPKVTGPFQVPPKPSTIRFSGRNLESVQSVTMTYTPAGQDTKQVTSEVREEGDISILQGGNGDPQVLVRNMPNLENLAQDEPAAVTFEFNGGARGSDYFTVQYEDREATILGPPVASFTGEKTLNILETTTYQNTTSFWRYDSRGGSGDEATPYGPIPKVWPGDRSWDARSNIFEQYWDVSDGELVEKPEWDATTSYSSSDVVYYRPTNDYYKADSSIPAGTNPDGDGNGWSLYRTPKRKVTNQLRVRSLQFNANRFNPTDILDVRIRKTTSGEPLIPQLAYAGARRYGDQTSSPYYYALQIENNQVEIIVPTYGQRYWEGQDFQIEYVYYPSALQGGGLHDGKEVILENKGEYESSDNWTSDTPSNPSIGDYYADPNTKTYWVYDDVTEDETENPTWHQAEHISFTSHGFTVQTAESNRAAEPETEVQFRAQTADAANQALINENTPRIAFDAANQNGRAEPAFTRELQDGSSLEINALINPSISGKTFVFDEFRYQSDDVESERGALPNNVKALAGTRKEGATFGESVVSSDADQAGNELIVDGGSVSSIAITSQYKEEKEIIGEVTAKLIGRSWSGYNEDGSNRISVETDVPAEPEKRVLFTPNGGSDEYLIEAGNKIEAEIGDTITVQGIYTSFGREWRGNNAYPVIRATDFAVGPTEPMRITGPNYATINYNITSIDDYGFNQDYTVNREIDPSLSGHSYDVYWAAGSETLSNLTSSISTGDGQATISVSADWEDLWVNRLVELREVRPDDRDIGNDYYDGPVYRENEVFDFRRPNINVLSLRLKIDATFEGQTRTKYVSVQIAPDYNNYYA